MCCVLAAIEAVHVGQRVECVESAVEKGWV